MELTKIIRTTILKTELTVILLSDIIWMMDWSKIISYFEFKSHFK